MGILDFSRTIEDLYADYGKYHTTAINKIIHVICVPQILYTLISLFAHFSWRIGTNPLTEIHLGIIPLAIILLLYIKLDFPSGLVAAVLYSALYFVGNYTFIYYGPSHLKFVGLVQLICWGLQFAGHALENKRPALVDNILLTLAAPLFVVIEVMFFFGYKPELHRLCESTLNKKDK
ncbi:unnamed protein product [Blepharisma stoltei]|uniref:Uncharacterized protein n=1 Tax=Blepharisma stoltei TaxID=1481888 RepID=A0AAU9IR07_9CILI|nr:unnamed protein product [Blepharisma stoltei]